MAAISPAVSTSEVSPIGPRSEVDARPVHARCNCARNGVISEPVRSIKPLSTPPSNSILSISTVRQHGQGKRGDKPGWVGLQVSPSSSGAQLVELSVVSHELYTGLYEGYEGVFMRCHTCWMCVMDMRA